MASFPIDRRTRSWLAAILLSAMPAFPHAAPAQTFERAPALPDKQLQEITGKFILPNGAEIALTVVSQTAVDNQVVLRSVFRLETGASVEVFGRTEDSAKSFMPASAAPASSNGPSSISVAFDRASGTSTINPIYTGAPATSVSLGASGGDVDPATWGLVPVAVTPGSPAVATIDGTIAVNALRSGTLVTLNGDQYSVSQLVGNAIASIVTNSANDRTIDTVTNVNIDLRDISVYTAGSAALRVDALALDAARGMVR